MSSYSVVKYSVCYDGQNSSLLHYPCWNHLQRTIRFSLLPLPHTMIHRNVSTTDLLSLAAASLNFVERMQSAGSIYACRVGIASHLFQYVCFDWLQGNCTFIVADYMVRGATTISIPLRTYDWIFCANIIVFTAAVVIETAPWPVRPWGLYAESEMLYRLLYCLGDYVFLFRGDCLNGENCLGDSYTVHC